METCPNKDSFIQSIKEILKLKDSYSNGKDSDSYQRLTNTVDSFPIREFLILSRVNSKTFWNIHYDPRYWRLHVITDAMIPCFAPLTLFQKITYKAKQLLWCLKYGIFPDFWSLEFESLSWMDHIPDNILHRMLLDPTLDSTTAERVVRCLRQRKR